MMAKEKFMEIAITYSLFEKINKKREKEINNKENESNLDEENDFNNIVEKFITSKTIYKKTTKSLFEIIKKYDFIKTSSVNKKYDIYLKNNFTNYDILENIDLLTHTLNVAYEASVDDKPKNIKSVNILLALLHDFGKNINIIKNYNKTNKLLSHEKISSIFAEEFFTDQIFDGNKEINSNLVKTLVETIKVQHSSVIASRNSYLYNLRKYDKEAREKEILLIKNKQRALR